MKKNHIILTVLLLGLSMLGAPQASFAAKDTIDSDCTFKGQKLQGKVKIVDNFPDFKVKVVDNFPDLKVKKVQSFPDQCGKWQIVENFPDFKIQIVESFPDFKIKYVDVFPGKP